MTVKSLLLLDMTF